MYGETVKYVTNSCSIFDVDLRNVHTNTCDITWHHLWHTAEACYQLTETAQHTYFVLYAIGL